MKFAVINAHRPEYLPLAKLTTYANRVEYCKRWGYSLLVMAQGWRFPAIHPVSWDRLAFMRDMLKSGQYDWAWCCGCDTFTTNMTIPLESFVDDTHHVVASCEWCSIIQADSFLVKNSPQGIGWLDMLLSLYPKYQNHIWVEQQAMIDTYEANKEIIKILPQRAMNSYHYPLYVPLYPGEKKVEEATDWLGNDGQWQPGDFLIHWPGITMQQRIQLAEKYAALVVR